MPSGSSQPTSLRKCCSARISVGAISAHCQPSRHRHRGRERRHHGLARAHIALQQAVHRHRAARGRRGIALQVGGDLVDHAALRRRQLERQRGQQLLVQPARRGEKRGARCNARSRCACRCEICCASSSSNFRRCQAGCLRSSSACGGASGGGWCSHCRRRAGWAGRAAAAARHDLGQVGALQRRADGLAQIGLRQRATGRIDRRQRARERCVFGRPTRNAGCTISRPKKPLRGSPRTRTRWPVPATSGGSGRSG